MVGTDKSPLGRRLRVALVAPALRTFGGQSVQAQMLRECWEGDPDVEVRFVPVNPPFPRWVAWLERIPVVRTIVRPALFFPALWSAAGWADVLHIFSASYWSFLLAPVPALMAARVRGKKAVLNYRSGEARDHLSHWRTALPFLRRADCLVVPSGYLAEVFREFGLSARVIPSVLDFDRFGRVTPRPFGPRLLCTRNFEPYYGVDVVIRAFAAVKEQFPEARLCLVGSGSLEKELRRLVQELGVGEVEFVGAVGRDRIVRYYQEASILVNASRLDNLPNAVLEGFAARLPVVSTAPEGMTHVIRHEETGLLSPVDDVAALAANLLRVLRDPALAQRLARNAYHSADRYRWANVRQQWLETFYTLIGEASQSPRSAVLAQASVEEPEGHAGERVASVEKEA